MNEAKFDRIQRLFLAALEQPEEQRESWLAHECGDDRELFREVAHFGSASGALRTLNIV